VVVDEAVDGPEVPFRGDVQAGWESEGEGMRPGQVDDVDFLRRTNTILRQAQAQTQAQAHGQSEATVVVVPPKYGSERVVHVPEQLVTMLAAHVQDIGVRGNEHWLLAGPGGDLLNRNRAAHHWRQVRDAVGLGGCTVHDLRHFYASCLIAAWCDVVTVQRTLGRSPPTITLGVDAHLWPTAEDKTNAAAADLMRSAITAPADAGLSHCR
jgi:integrase